MSNKIKKYSVGFTQVPNELLNSSDISLNAKGLYAFMMSKPGDWNFTIKSMSKQLKEGVTAISNGLNELKESGWIAYEKHQDGTGTYHIFSNPNLENPNLENPNLENPNLGKPNRINNKDSIQTNIGSNKDCSLPAHANANAPAESTIVFNAYCEGMKQAYGENVKPARNAKINKMLKSIIERIGFENAVLVARNYPLHRQNWYVQKAHAVDYMLQDCESLLIQIQSGQMVTRTSAYQADKTGHYQNQAKMIANKYQSDEVF